VLLAAGGGLWRWSVRVRFERALDRARAAMDDPQLFSTRATRARERVQRESRLQVAEHLVQTASNIDGPERTHAEALAHLLAGTRSRALVPLSGTDQVHDAATWNDLAAIHAAAATATGDSLHLLSALSASSEAMAIEPTAEAQFTYAAIVEQLGLHFVADPLWHAYLQHDPSSAWATIAKEHLASRTTTDDVYWRKQINPQILKLPERELIGETRVYPQQARTWAEGVYLSNWATAWLAGNTKDAQTWLEHARIIGRTIRDAHGESLLIDAVEVVDQSSQRETLARGHLAYRDGRRALSLHDVGLASAKLTEAVNLLDRAASPLADVARVYLAGILIDQSRPLDARAILDPVVARKRNSSHRAVLAHALHELSLCDAQAGRWSTSLSAAQESLALSNALGERGSTAHSEVVLSEDYDFLGLPDLARRTGLNALRHADSAGDIQRVRAALATLSRIELRGGRWMLASGLIALEKRVAAIQGDPTLDADMHQRNAAAQWHRQKDEAAIAALTDARKSAKAVSAPNQRRRYYAEINATEAVMIRTREPQRAIGLLNVAIDFQDGAGRLILLPQLHLERARAYLALNDINAAERDLDQGIAELERQRTSVRDAQLRPGIFDDAAELFHDAVSLQLRYRKDAKRALEYVERGRARTMLEELARESVTPMAIGDVQRRLDEDTTLLEYVALPDRLAIFAISRDEIVVRTVPISREELKEKAAAFVSMLTKPSDASQTRAVATQLYEILLEPVRKQLRTKVAVIADDVLQRVPIGALFDERTGTFVIERATLVNSPSATAYVMTSTPRHAAPHSILLFANPTPSQKHRDLAPLTGAEREAAGIAQAYAGQRIERRETATATAAQFLTLAPQFEVVHFGGHAIVHPTDPSSSALICASSDDDNGDVAAHQISALRFTSTRVVVLAACSTATGRNAAIEGVASLARAFLAAGVPSVIGTSWDIDDREAAPLMRALHKQLARGMSPADALRAAQLQALHSTRDADRHPGHWAAFSVIGAH